MKRNGAFFEIVIVLCALTNSTNGQNYPDGFYLTMDCGEYQKRLPVKLARRQEVCLPNKPLIDISGIDSLTPLVVVSEVNSISFLIVLTSESVSRFRRLSDQLPSATFAFVLNNDVYFTFRIQKERFNHQIRVTGNYPDAGVPYLHDQLNTLLLHRQVEK